MKFLLDKIEKSKKDFEPGGKMEKLYPLFEANDTFLFTPSDVTESGPHVRDAIDIKRVMITVVVALMPCFLFGIWNAGHQYNIVNQVAGASLVSDIIQGLIMVMPIVLVSYAVGGFWEVLFAVTRKHEINEGFLVTGLLFPLTLPPTVPLWQVAVGISFGVVVGKEIFGGTGFNVLNPALTARAFLFFAYPVQLSGNVWTKISEGADTIAGFTGATPLAVSALLPKNADVVGALNGTEYGSIGFSWMNSFIGTIPGSIGETSALLCLVGALILVLTGVGAWRIMLGGVIGLAIMSTLLNQLPAEEFKAFTQLPFHWHLVIGSFAFGIVFMATDPVSAAATNTGKWIYGGLIGVLTILIRVTNPAYPEGVMLSILFMNVMAPLIDHIVVQSHIKKREKYLRSFQHA